MRVLSMAAVLCSLSAPTHACILTWEPPTRPAGRAEYRLTERQGEDGAWTLFATLPWGTTTQTIACDAPYPRCWQLTLHVLNAAGATMGASAPVETCEEVAETPPPTAQIASMDSAYRETAGVNAALAQIADAEAALPRTAGIAPAPSGPLSTSAQQATIDHILTLYQQRIDVIWQYFVAERDRLQHAPKASRPQLERELWDWAQQSQQQAFRWATQQVDYVLRLEE